VRARVLDDAHPSAKAQFRRAAERAQQRLTLSLPAPHSARHANVLVSRPPSRVYLLGLGVHMRGDDQVKRTPARSRVPLVPSSLGSRAVAGARRAPKEGDQHLPW
jgi:hypothetical protein